MDSILATPPVSSPLHPQAGLLLLKGYLKTRGFKTRILDTNISFFRWLLGDKPFEMSTEQFFNEPMGILKKYNLIEKALWEKSSKYEGLAAGMRYLEMKHDRTRFDSVVAAVTDRKANPFIEFYEEVIVREYMGSGLKIAGISITFQDQIIPAFTLAALLRERMPEVKIVLGGQMITRCHGSMVKHAGICRFFDYLVLWEGEIPLLNIHRTVIRGEDTDFTNVIDLSRSRQVIDRKSAAPAPGDIPEVDLDDIDFNSYFFPDMLVPLQTTRGCYGCCEFCAIPFGANSYRMRSKDDIVREISRIQKETLARYGRQATYFKFMEDTSSPALLFDLSVEIERLGLNVKWETFARLDKYFARDGVMKQLYRGGCRKIHWGLESSDPGVLQNMNKKIGADSSTKILDLADEAGIFNFCFVLIGFPGETDEARSCMIRYIVEHQSIHAVTPTTFDLTRGAPMELNFKEDNPYGMTRREAEDFEVRLPYMIHGESWKEKIVPKAHELMMAVVSERPDIGFVSVFPDQVRSMLCDRFGNRWGSTLGKKYGEEIVRELILNTAHYMKAFAEKKEIDAEMLPEALRREHFRTKEDIRMISEAVLMRRSYESRRFNQV